MDDFKTIEDAKAKILELQEENTKLTTERDTLFENNKTLTEELGSVKKLNQQYFNKLSQQYLPEDDDPDPEPEPSLEEFALTLKI